MKGEEENLKMELSGRAGALLKAAGPSRRGFLLDDQAASRSFLSGAVRRILHS